MENDNGRKENQKRNHGIFQLRFCLGNQSIAHLQPPSSKITNEIHFVYIFSFENPFIYFEELMD